MRLNASFMKEKAKSKRRQAKSRTIPTWRLKAKPNTGPGKLKKRSGRSKKYSRSKLGGLCAGHVFCFRRTHQQPYSSRVKGKPEVNRHWRNQPESETILRYRGRSQVL